MLRIKIVTEDCTSFYPISEPFHIQKISHEEVKRLINFDYSYNYELRSWKKGQTEAESDENTETINDPDVLESAAITALINEFDFSIEAFNEIMEFCRQFWKENMGLPCILVCEDLKIPILSSSQIEYYIVDGRDTIEKF